MDQSHNEIAAQLRAMDSAAAARWLIETHPTSGTALKVIPHRSWRRAEQDLLAHHYLSPMAFAAGWPYEAFLSVMSVSRFIRVIDTHFPSDPRKADLALYFLAPRLRAAARGSRDAAAVEAFLLRRGAGAATGPGS